MSTAKRTIIVRPAGTYDHVQMTIQQSINQLSDIRHIVGKVAIDQHINIGFNIGKHSAHNITFTTFAFVTDRCTCFKRPRRRLVGGCVVVNEDVGLGK